MRKEKLIKGIEKKMKELYKSYNSKVVKTWSESQKKEWHNIYGMVEALEIITNEKYVIDEAKIIKNEKIGE